MAKKPRKNRRSKSKRRPSRSARRQKPRRKARPKPRRKIAARRKPKKARRKPAKVVKAARVRRQKPKARARARTTERPLLDRSRRVLPDEERLELDAAASRAVAGQDRMLSAARTGHDELRQELGRHTAASPKMTAGDVDAKWQDAYAVGDEAPGGDNPTPDQDRVDDIGRALGIQYQDDQELMGGEEVTERDRHRWERDPASADDWPHGKEKDKS